MTKRIFDIVASSLGLLAFSPILLVVALWVKLDSKGPVFYRGERTGKNNKTFRIYKFRSMVVNADKIGGASTSGSDSRVTKSGKFIRKCKLDELSQLINVFVGDMSMVGPRPEVKKYTDMYVGEEKEILDIRPGITDWASIWNSDEGRILEGYHDADEGYEKFIRPGKLQLQLKYRREHNVPTDIKIICYTMYRIFNGDFYPKELASFPRLVPIMEQKSTTHAAVQMNSEEVTV
jgi:lipopolysaccharide/colanic/teichoic acid biosynthesis glycosyltransferase